MRILGVTKGYRGLQGVTQGYKRVTRGYRELKGLTGGYKGLQGLQGLTIHAYIAVSYTHLTLPTNREV